MPTLLVLLYKLPLIGSLFPLLTPFAAWAKLTRVTGFREGVVGTGVGEFGRPLILRLDLRFDYSSCSLFWH